MNIPPEFEGDKDNRTGCASLTRLFTSMEMIRKRSMSHNLVFELVSSFGQVPGKIPHLSGYKQLPISFALSLISNQLQQVSNNQLQDWISVHRWLCHASICQPLILEHQDILTPPIFYLVPCLTIGVVWIGSLDIRAMDTHGVVVIAFLDYVDHITITGTDKKDKSHLCSTSHLIRHQLWLELSSLQNLDCGPWLYIRDFNAVPFGGTCTSSMSTHVANCYERHRNIASLSLADRPLSHPPPLNLGPMMVTSCKESSSSAPFESHHGIPI
ncbi:hypothetical protein A2U01_0000915 [Trifolium medium]|uniref:Uncharacterized protein n=1 Tax=Trifolium medium TaxID=97028 RepID=A0A392LYU3_9FABA|nr:hypothetical protein [Trifolium medium]